MGREFTVTVLEIKGGKVKLGFNADPSVSVQRSEVWARVHTGELPDGHTEGFGALALR
jgi:carbon storage regulator CsrA